MAKAQKLPSGTWRIRVYDYTDEEGKKHKRSFTGSTKAEVEYKAAEFVRNKEKIKRPRNNDELTLREVVDKYIELRKLSSPTTLEAYRKVKEHAFSSIMDMKVKDIDQITMQKAVNQEAMRFGKNTGKPISPKTVKNEYFVIEGAIRAVCGITYTAITLPTVQYDPKILPEPEDVIKAIKGTKAELPAMIAMWMGCSLSEIRGIMCSAVDQKNQTIVIRQTKVEVGREAVVKATAKEKARKRVLSCPDVIMRKIVDSEPYKAYKKDGKDRYIINLTIHEIRHHYSLAIKHAGLKASFHDLRHIYATVMLTKLGLPEKVVQTDGGWTTDHVMKRVYSNQFASSKAAANSARDKYFNSII